jgi:geranylgeranylglycerol-phosphate geranylgeranyltransferase
MHDRWRGLLELTRPGNAVAAGALAFVGAFVGAGLALPIPTVAAIAATVLATAAGNAINDYFDREIDRENRPDRPIPRRAVSPRGALGFALALFVAAVGFVLVLPTLAIAIAVVNCLALVAYTEYFKGLPGVGNAIVSALTGSAVLFGGAAVGNVRPVLVLGALAALATMAREIVKDVEDVEGDRSEGLQTLPIVIGEQAALRLAVVPLVLAIAASPIPYLYDLFGLPYLAVVVPADGVMLWGMITAFSAPARGQRLLKAGMFLAAMAFLVGHTIVVGHPQAVS